LRSSAYDSLAPDAAQAEAGDSKLSVVPIAVGASLGFCMIVAFLVWLHAFRRRAARRRAELLGQALASPWSHEIKSPAETDAASQPLTSAPLTSAGFPFPNQAFYSPCALAPAGSSLVGRALTVVQIRSTPIPLLMRSPSRRTRDTGCALYSGVHVWYSVSYMYLL
jgi:hypothetical protein